MAKKRKNRRKQNDSVGFAGVLLSLVAVFALLVGANSAMKFSPKFPTIDTLMEQWEQYINDYNPQPKTPSNEQALVHFIDVGQGSCVLIQVGESAALFDAGEVDQGENVVRYLKQNGVTKLDYVVASHPHSDHIGGLAEVIHSIPTEHLFMPELSSDLIPTTRVYERLLDAIEQNNVTVISPTIGATYSVGTGGITILGPSGAFKDLNNMSVAARFSYGDTAFLYTADMEQQAELALLKREQTLGADVYALGHHGSSTSSSNELLAAVRATYYVAQCGYQNTYYHPHAEVLKRAKASGGKIFRNDLQGSIVFTSDGKKLSVQTEK